MESTFNDLDNKTVSVRVQTNEILHVFLLLYSFISQKVSKNTLNLIVLVNLKYQSAPLSPFLTFFIMAPTFTNIYELVAIPYMNGEIQTPDALNKASKGHT